MRYAPQVTNINKGRNDVLSHAMEVWTAADRPFAELEAILRVVAERAFIASVWPAPGQIAQWKATGSLTKGLAGHILRTTGRIVTVETAERLWRLFTSQPQPRRRRTVFDFLGGFTTVLKCKHCGDKKGPFHVDHVVPLAKGGIESITNLQILCETCNLKKGSKLDPAVIYIRFDNQERNT